MHFFHIATSKVVRARQFFNILTLKCASRYSVFCTFLLENVLFATAACNFSTSPLQKVLRNRQFFTILTLKYASRYSGVQFLFMSPCNSHLRARHFTEVTFRPRPPTKSLKNTAFRDFLNISRLWIFFLLIFA